MANSNKDGLAGSIAGELHIGIQGPPGPVGPQGPVGPVGPEATPLTVVISGTAASHSASEIIAAIKAEKIVEVSMGTERLQVTAWDESAVTVTCAKAPAPNRSGALLSCNEYTIRDDKTWAVVANNAISTNFTAKSGQAIVVASADPNGPTSFEGADIPDIFTAQYGTTTFTEIANAVSAGKTVECRKDYIVLPMLRFSPQAAVITFGGTADGQSVTWKLHLGVWSESNVQIGTGDGLSATASGLLIEILRNGVYSTDQSDNITALATALGVTEPDVPEPPVEPDEPDVPVVKTYTITNNLTNVTNGNSASAVEEGKSYSATLTASEGYKLDTVTVTMGGVDVTSTVYLDGTISIATVSGDIVITATAVGAPVNVPISKAHQNYQDYTMYSDGGTAEIGTAKCVHFITDEVFAKDTEVEITITNVNNSNVYQPVYGACCSQEDIDNNVLAFYYGEKLKDYNFAGTYKLTYTVKAGYKLAVLAWEGQTSNLDVVSVTK